MIRRHQGSLLWQWKYASFQYKDFWLQASARVGAISKIYPTDQLQFDRIFWYYIFNLFPFPVILTQIQGKFKKFCQIAVVSRVPGTMYICEIAPTLAYVWNRNKLITISLSELLSILIFMYVHILYSFSTGKRNEIHVPVTMRFTTSQESVSSCGTKRWKYV